MKIDINVGVSDAGREKTFAFRLSFQSRKILGKSVLEMPSGIAITVEDFDAKLKDLGKLRLRMVAQMLTGKKRPDMRFRMFCGKRMQFRVVRI